MAIMTPTGLKIRLGIEWSFALLARLWMKDPATDAFRVLKTCEAIEYVPTVATLLAGLAATLLSRDLLWTIPASIVAGRLAGFILTQAGMFAIIRPLGLLALGRIWCHIPYTSIIFYVLLLGTLFATLGWIIPALWVVGGIAAWIMTVVAEFACMRRNFRLTGEPLSPSEVNFFNAYRLHADRLGLTRDLTVPDEEIASENWKSCLMDYAAKYPEAVARFPR